MEHSSADGPGGGGVGTITAQPNRLLPAGEEIPSVRGNKTQAQSNS